MTEWLSGGGLATLAALSGATIASIITAMWLRGRYEQELALVEQQADNELKLSQAREAQLQQQLQQSNEELDEMDVERD